MADLIIGGALVATALAWLLTLGLARAAARPTPNAAAAPEVKPVPPRATCQAPLCGELACTRVHVNDEFLLLCMGHGLPLLTEGMAA